MVLAQADGGRRRSRFRRRIGRKEDVFSAMLVLVPEGKIEVDLRGKLGYAERLPKIIAGAASECFNRYILVSICRDDDNGNRRRNILDFSHGLDAGHIGQPVFNDRKINLAVSLHPFDRYPAALCCDDLIGAGKVLDISVEKSSVVINDQYMRISSVFHGRQSAISFPPSWMMPLRRREALLLYSASKAGGHHGVIVFYSPTIYFSILTGSPLFF